ncbi:MAG: GatB/YqeY domain-containing protein [Desulfobacterales bacterium]
MNLQNQIKKDLSAAIKARDENKKDALRVILGEFGRLDKKELSDDEVVKILKKLIKSEKEVLEQKGEAEDSAFIEIVESYLPQMAAEEEISAWIRQNVDFSQFKNKIQAMGIIMKHFGATADGSVVREILQKM